MTTRSTLIAVMLLGLFATRDSHAHCKIGEATNLPIGMVDQYVFATTGDTDVPVYLVAPNATVIGHTPTLVGRAIGRAIDAINRYSYAGVRLRYAGVVSTLPSGSDYGIYIRENSSCTACNGAIACTNLPMRQADPSLVQNITTNLIYNPGACPAHNWQFYPDFVSTDDIQGTVTHELLHALGLAHAGNINGNCPMKATDAGTDGIMATTSSQYTDQRYLSRDDAEGLIALYFSRLSELDYQWSTDGQTWADGVLLNDSYVLSAVGSASTTLAGGVKVHFSYRPVAGTFVPNIQAMLFASAGSAVSLNTTQLWDPPAATYGNSTLMVAALGGETTTDRSKNVQWHRSTNSGASWTVANASSAQTMRDGVGLAYEPGTQRFVLAYLGDSNYTLSQNQNCTDGGGLWCDQIRFATIKSDGTNLESTALLDAGGNPIRAASAPMVVCGPDNIDTNNCVVAWTSTTGNACIHWGHFDIDAGGEVVLFNDLSSPCYAGYSPAFLMFSSSIDAKPFRMTFSQEGTGQTASVYALRKSASPAAAWSDLSSYVVTPWRILGGYGGLFDGANPISRSFYIRHAD